MKGRAGIRPQTVWLRVQPFTTSSCRFPYQTVTRDGHDRGSPRGGPALPWSSTGSSWPSLRVRPGFSASGKCWQLSEDLLQVEDIPSLHPRGKSPGLKGLPPSQAGCVAWGQSLPSLSLFLLTNEHVGPDSPPLRALSGEKLGMSCSNLQLATNCCVPRCWEKVSPAPSTSVALSPQRDLPNCEPSFLSQGHPLPGLTSLTVPGLPLGTPILGRTRPGQCLPAAPPPSGGLASSRYHALRAVALSGGGFVGVLDVANKNTIFGT